MPLPRSTTPAKPTTPRLLTVSSMLPPRFPRQGLRRLMNFEAQSRGFNTRCLRFTNDVAITHARLASGWLARLCREGVQPSGSRQKVSVRLILLFWIYPGARETSSRSPMNMGIAVGYRATGTMGTSDPLLLTPDLVRLIERHLINARAIEF